MCDGNKLKSLPYLTNNIEEIYYSSNQLTSLPDLLPDSLEILHCDNNPLTKLPNSLSLVVKLQISVNQLILFSKLDPTIYPTITSYLTNIENLIIVDKSPNISDRSNPNISDRKNVEENLVRFDIMGKLKKTMGNRVDLDCPVFIKSMKNTRKMSTTILTRTKNTTPKSTTSKSKKISDLPKDLQYKIAAYLGGKTSKK
jgi:hypothetical protein